MSKSLQIFTFGGLRIFLNGQPVEFPTRKVEALLIFLACIGQPYSRQQLADLLWDDRSEEQAMTNLRATLSRLKQQLGPFLSIDRRTIGLEVETDIWVDAMSFLKFLEPDAKKPSLDRISALENAVKLYQGEFLEGFYVNESLGFDHWLTVQREMLRAHALKALSQLADHALDQGAYEKGLLYTSRILQLNPFSEEAYQQTMLLLARSGQRARALAQYHTCEDVLKKELGLKPDPKTTEIYEQIVAGKIGASSERRLNQAPLSTTPFVGRHNELSQIQQSLDNTACRLLSLTGIGGIGKTRLAYQTAQANLYAFEDSVLFIPLAGLTSSQFLAATIAQALGINVDSMTSSPESVLAYLSTRHLLLVLDNFEHLLDNDATRLLRDILAHAPRVKILVTSRERLNLYEEWVFNVQGLAYPEHFDPSLEQYGAVQLFLQGAQRVQPLFSVQEHSQGVIRLCQLVEGLPLALELATYWLKVMSCEQLVAEVEGNMSVLSASFRHFPERHASIQTIFEYSWARLSSREQQILMKMSIFRGSFSMQAAQDVAQATFADLDALLSASLIRFSSEQNRYSLHELIRRFSYERPEMQLEETHQAHLDYILRFTEKAEQGLFGSSESEWLESIEIELDNIRVALAWADQRGLRMAILTIAVRLYRFWLIRSLLTEGSQWIVRGLDQSSPLDPTLHSMGLARLGAFANLMGQQEQSTSYYQQAASIARQHGNTERLVAALNGLGVVALQRQEYQTAREYYRECLDLCRAHNYQRLMCVALLNLSVIFQEEADYGEAKNLLFEGLTIARTIGNPQYIADILNNLGSIAYEEEEYELAFQYFEESLALYGKLKNTVNIMTIMHILVNIYLAQRDLVKARQTSDEMKMLGEQVDNQLIHALLIYTLARVHVEEGALPTARTLLMDAIRQYNHLDDKRMLVFCLYEMAVVMSRCRYEARALHLFSAAQTLLATLTIKLPQQTQKRFQDVSQQLRKHFSEGDFAHLWQQGEQMSRAEVIAYSVTTP